MPIGSGAAVDSDAELEIIDVATGEPDALSAVLPAALAQLSSRDGPDETMARGLWLVVAALQAGQYTPETADTVRALLRAVNDALQDMRAAADGIDHGRGDDALRRYTEATRRLNQSATPDRDESEALASAPGISPSWALVEYSGWEAGYVRGEDDRSLLVDALQEAAGYPAGATPVRAVRQVEAELAPPGVRQVTVESLPVNRRAWERTPVFTAGTPVAATAYHGQVHPTASTARFLETRKRWRHVQQVARGETAGVREAAQMLSRRPKTAMLEFATTASGTVIYAMVPGADLDARPLPEFPGSGFPAVFTVPEVTSKDLDDWIYGPGGWMTAYDRRRHFPRPWQDKTDELLALLYAKLFVPLRRWLGARGVRHLVVVPHRGLHLLPLTAWFERVRGRRRYVGDEYDVSFAPSLTLLDICRRRIEDADPSPVHKPLMLLDPASNLPWSRLDALAMRPVPDRGRVLVGREVTMTQWSRLSADADPCHYAGHAAYRRHDPLASDIDLHDGALTLGSMFDDAVAVVPGGTVVLSGCETTMTDYRDAADEYLGIASGFLFAGSATVLSSHWAVADGAAALLTAEYYASLERSEPATALRAAQHKLRHVSHRDFGRLLKRADTLVQQGRLDAASRSRLEQVRRDTPDFSHPVYWAAYTVTGLPRPSTGGFQTSSSSSGSEP